jgi:hypothetical protein
MCDACCLSYNGVTQKQCTDTIAAAAHLRRPIVLLPWPRQRGSASPTPSAVLPGRTKISRYELRNVRELHTCGIPLMCEVRRLKLHTRAGQLLLYDGCCHARQSPALNGHVASHNTAKISRAMMSSTKALWQLGARFLHCLRSWHG